MTIHSGAPAPTTNRARRVRRAAAVAAVAALAAGAASACTDTATTDDGFETQAPGAAPSGAWSVVQPDCAGTGTVTVDASTAHQGSRSLKVAGGEGYCNHVFAQLGLQGTDTWPVVHGRFWVRHTTALPTGHTTFLAMPNAAPNQMLRMGGQNGRLMWNRMPDDATLPEQSPAGVALSADLPVNQWTCVRFSVDTATGNMATAVGDADVVGMTSDGTPTHDIDGQWLNGTAARPVPTALRLGWESYGGGKDTLWFDDVAVGAGPIDC